MPRKRTEEAGQVPSAASPRRKAREAGRRAPSHHCTQGFSTSPETHKLHGQTVKAAPARAECRDRTRAAQNTLPPQLPRDHGSRLHIPSARGSQRQVGARAAPYPGGAQSSADNSHQRPGRALRARLAHRTFEKDKRANLTQPRNTQ